MLCKNLSLVYAKGVEESVCLNKRYFSAKSDQYDKNTFNITVVFAFSVSQRTYMEGITRP